MKVKFFSRVALGVCGLWAALLGVCVALGGIGILPVQVSGLTEAAPVFLGLSVGQWIAVGVGAVSAVLGVYTLLFPRKLRTRRKAFVTQKTESGELRISVRAIENLVQRCVDMHEEIRLVDMDIVSARHGVDVDMRISLASNVSIPLAVASLQKQIRQYLLASSGIEVSDVSVTVETTANGEARRDTPYAVPEEGVAVAEPPRKEKKALHQRLFGHVEQPATVPDAPASEEAPVEAAEVADTAETETCAAEAAEPSAEREASVETEETTAEERPSEMGEDRHD